MLFAVMVTRSPPSMRPSVGAKDTTAGESVRKNVREEGTNGAVYT